jgi:cytochrome bd-type quinol oxidase subunit 2
MEGSLQARARRFAANGWAASAVLLAAMIGASVVARPDFADNFTSHRWLLIIPIWTLAALALTRYYISRDDRRAFIASSAYVAGILASVAGGLYPMLLPAVAGSAFPGLDIYNAAAPYESMRTALVVYAIGISLVSVYLARIYRVWKGKSGQVYT